MKRIIALICVMITGLAMMAPIGAAAVEKTAAVTEPGFEVRSSSPADGDERVAIDNFSIKIYFSKEMVPANKTVYKNNAKQFTLKDEEGEKIPVKVYYDTGKERKRGLVLVAADYSDNNKNDIQIKGDETYILTIGDGLQASDGTKYNQTTTIKVKTLNQQRSTLVYMILMVGMMVGMVFFTVRSAKKAEEKKKEEKTTKGSNPYKEAKKTGKSVDEIVERDNKKKRKKEEAEEKRREAEAALEAEILEKMRREKNKRVSAPAPITKAGGTYKPEVKKSSQNSGEKKTNKGTTNPKNQSGKKKNSGKKKGKKK